MTAKRFIVKNIMFDGDSIVDTIDSGYYTTDKQDLENLCKLLNELHEENQLLLKASEKDSELIKTLRKGIHQWRKENEFLKERLKELK